MTVGGPHRPCPYPKGFHMTALHTAALTWYATILKGWQPKLMGAKPTAEMFHKVHMLGFRPGVEALHLAMCLREGGCTVQQFCIAGSCGPANNKRRLVTQRGHAKVTVSGTPYAYQLTLTDKGLKVIAANEVKAADQPAPAPKASTKAKAKAASKPKGARKARPATVKAPAPQTAPVVTATSPDGNVPQTTADAVKGDWFEGRSEPQG